MKRTTGIFVGLVVAILSVGCNKNVETPFVPATVETAGDNHVMAPVGTTEDPYPEMITQDDGHDDGLDWAMSRGYIHAPIEDVWEVLKRPEVVVDRRRAARYEQVPYVMPEPTEEMPIVPVYDYAFINHVEVDDLITIAYEQTWLHDAVQTPSTEQNQPDELVGVVAAYSKTWGTSFISKMFGSVELTPIDENTTEISIVQKMDAIQTDSGDIAAWQTDMYVSIVEVVHGRALPVW